ncbi:hypothetical protein [Streptomyces sp. NPDC059003]|uniref:hypothetical protein n=1 Tax=Streptomyces sp. NPDC059003 TaxID=3346691 RepID=UPI0036CA4958
MNSDSASAIRAAAIAAAGARAATGVEFVLDGDLALHVHGAMWRSRLEIALVTEEAFDAERALPTAAAALQRVSRPGSARINFPAHGSKAPPRSLTLQDGTKPWAHVVVLPVAAEPVFDETVSGPVQVSQPGSVPLALDFTEHGGSPTRRPWPFVDTIAPRPQLVLARMPQYAEPVAVAETPNLRVSSVATLIMRALQAVRTRTDPRDFLDLAALQERCGVAVFHSLVVKSLQFQERRAPRSDPAERFLELYHSLGRVSQLSNESFLRCGTTRLHVRMMHDAITGMADHIAQAAPRTRGEAGLELEIFQLPEDQRQAMRAALLAIAVDAPYIRARLPEVADALTEAALERLRTRVAEASGRDAQGARAQHTRQDQLTPGPGSAPRL